MATDILSSEEADPITDVIKWSTLGFLKVTKESASSAGSGTLVSIDGRDAILTAAHVFDELLKIKTVGVVVFTRSQKIQRAEIDMQRVDSVRISCSNYTINGPDLALVWLYPEIASTLKSILTSIDIRVHQQRYAQLAKLGDTALHIVCGVVAERTGCPRIEDDRIKITFEALMVSGKFHIEPSAGKLDRLRFEPGPDEMMVPSSYQGMSGGGAWQIITEQGPDGKYVRKTSLLMGVAFFEKVIENAMNIYCHGPKSIYSTLMQKIDSSS